jgi:hypothetical protein
VQENFCLYRKGEADFEFGCTVTSEIGFPPNTALETLIRTFANNIAAEANTYAVSLLKLLRIMLTVFM